MLKFKKVGNVKVDQNIKVIQDRLNKVVDMEYYYDNQHKWSSNNIELRSTEKIFYGQINNSGFYISGKYLLFREKFDDIEINGKFIEKDGKTQIEYEISSKPHKLIVLIIINIVLISSLFIIPYASGLESEKMKGYIGIPILLLYLDISIPIGLKKKLSKSEKKLKEIITTPFLNRQYE